MSAPQPADELALRALAYEYAAAVDQRDPERFVSVFDPSARLHVYGTDDPDHPATDMTGHDQLARIPERIKRFDRTFHFVGNTSYDVDGDTATGEVYCLAHHLTEAGERSTDLVMVMRYQDTYRRADGGWKIVDRRALVDWTEIRAAGHAFGRRPEAQPAAHTDRGGQLNAEGGAR